MEHILEGLPGLAKRRQGPYRKTVPVTYTIEATFDVGQDTFRCDALRKLTVNVGE